MTLWYMKRWRWWNAVPGAVRVYGWTAWGWLWARPLGFIWIAWWQSGGWRERVGRWALCQCGNWRLASFRRECLEDAAQERTHGR